MMLSRRKMLFQTAALAGLAGLPRLAGAAQPVKMVMYKTPQCGCCDKWAAQLSASGFDVRTEERNDLYAIKMQLGVPHDLQSCHTALVEGYVVEGHVPARDIQRLLTERPQARGLAVPGMPLGSPGMEVGGRKDPFDVVLFGGKTKPRVFARY